MDSHLAPSHSQEINISFSNSQLFREAVKLAPFTSPPSTLTTEDETPASRKRVTMVKKQTQEISVNVRVQLNSSTDDSLWSTPSRKDHTKGTAKTLKKGQSMQEMTFLPMTVNKNKHATKAYSNSQTVPAARPQKARKSPVFGKRKFEEYEEDEYEVAYKQKTINVMTPEWKEDTLKPLVNLDAKKVKMTEAEKPKPKEAEQIFLYNHLTETFDCYPVWKDKDLGYNAYFQGELRDAEVDNDCATDNEVLNKVFQWTLDDLYEGLKKHYEENEVADGKTEKEIEDAREDAKERWKKYLYGCGELSSNGDASGTGSDHSSDSASEHRSESGSDHGSDHGSESGSDSGSGSGSGSVDPDESSSEEYTSNYQEIKIAESGNQIMK